MLGEEQNTIALTDGNLAPTEDVKCLNNQPLELMIEGPHSIHDRRQEATLLPLDFQIIP